MQPRFRRLAGLLSGKVNRVFEQELEVVRVIDDDVVFSRAMDEEDLIALKGCGGDGIFFDQAEGPASFFQPCHHRITDLVGATAFVREPMDEMMLLGVIADPIHE